MHVQHAQDALAHLERDGGFGARVRQDGVGEVGGVFQRVAHNQRLAAPGDVTNDGFRADAQFVSHALELRAGFAGGLADHGEFVVQVEQEYAGVIEVEAFADQVDGA